MGMFGLTGTATLVLAVAGLVGVTGVTVVGWDKLANLGRHRWPARVGLLLAGQVSAVLITGLLLNDAFDFYPSWAELFGAPPTTAQPAAAAAPLAQVWQARIVLTPGPAEAPLCR